ncbi:MAG: DegT/DnrJ/EryC1/StrS family aminotransferase, partial [Gemmataceae bacterium]|nr:DegT/DnrJ/EryC1/StrS family aminotransferase [Gemmataceae bacterium]
EDAAQCPGAVVDGRPAGTWGDVGTLSFGGSKLLTAGRGGGLLFRDATLYQRAKTFLHRGVQQWAAPSELQACVLRPQLRALRERTLWRMERVRELLAGGDNPPPRPPSLQGGGREDAGTPDPRDPLEATNAPLPSGRGAGVGVPLLPLALRERSESLPAFYKLGFRFDPAAFGLSRELFVKALRAEGVAFDAGFKALHVGRSPSRFRAAGALTNAEDAHARCVILHHPVLSLGPEGVKQVATAVAKVYRYRDEFRAPTPTPD